MGSLRLLLKLLKLYASCGLVHVVVKVFRMWYRSRAMRQMLAPVPRARYPDGVLGILPHMLENMHRRYDYVNEVTAGLPIARSNFGPTFDPGSFSVLVRDPAVVKHMLKDKFDNYTKPPGERSLMFRYLKIWLGDGIFVERHGPDADDEGRNWQKQRKIASNIFTRGNFNNNMCDVFVAKGKRFCELLKAPSKDGQKIDMQAKFFSYTMDSIMEIFFGEKVDTMGGKANEYAMAYDTAHRCLIDYVLKSMAPLQLLKLLPWPFGGMDGLAAQLHRKTHPGFQEFKVALHTLDVESRRIVEATRADPKIGDRKDLLALFVNNKDRSSVQNNNTAPSEPSEHMPTEWLRDVVLNFIIAGRDTTACTLSWMFFILATHPEIQKKVQAEIDAKFKPGAIPTMQSVSASELPYLNGVLYETLRLYPPVPIDGKEAVADDVLPGGTKIPMGTNMDFFVYAMGRDPAVYAEPTTVRPERWIPFKEPSQYEFPVFQAGPRICLGMNMALFEAKIVALMLLREFSFDLLAGEKEKISYLPTSLTMSLCNSGGKKYDSHNLWLIPTQR